MKIMRTVTPDTSEITSYLVFKKWSILTLKWLSYFPIQINFGLTDFRMRLCSCSFFLQFLRTFVILLFFTFSRIAIIDPTWENYHPFATKNNSTNKNSTAYEVSKKYNFSSLVDYFKIIQVLLYVVLLTVVCKNFAKFLTKLCQSVNVLDEVLSKPIPTTTRTFWKLYIGLFFQLLTSVVIECAWLILGILHPQWWMDTMAERIDSIIQTITYSWLQLAMLLFELIFTISVTAIRDRLTEAQTISHNTMNQQVILRKMIEVLENFKMAFGGILTINLSFYTLDCMTETFSIVIFVSAKNYIGASFFVIHIIGSLFRLYNIVSGCELLTKEIEEYVECLNECDTRNEGHSSGGRVIKNLKKKLMARRNISASGFFDINKSMLISILSTAVCYLIILVQFYMTFESQVTTTVISPPT